MEQEATSVRMHQGGSAPGAVRGRPPSDGAAWPWLGALLALLAGTGLQLQQTVLWPGGVYAALGAAGGLLVLAGRRWPGRGGRTLRLGVVLGLVLLGLALAGARATRLQAQALDPALEGQDLVVEGMVAAMPQRSEGGLRFPFEVAAATREGVAVTLPPRVWLGWYAANEGGAAPPALRAGERWRLTLRLKAPHGSRNPHGFDHELWLWEQGLGATGYVRQGPRDAPAQRLAATAQHPVEQARQAVREAIERQLAPGAGDDAAAARRRAGVVVALVTGDQAAIERADWDVFRATGVAHLMSISGLHITLFAWLAAGAVGALWRGSARWGLSWCLPLPAPVAARVGGLLLAGAYALFSGWGVPAQRTVLMLATVTLLRLSGRQWPWPLLWTLAAAVVALADPWALLQAGFWLSFVAVGVLFATDSGAAHARVEGARGQFLEKLRRLVREQAVVTVALTPLTLLLFGQVSLVGLGANLVAIPWVTLVVTPLALAGLLWAPLWQAAAGALSPLAWALQGLAALPLATLSVPQPALWAGAAGVAGGGLLMLRAPWGLRALGLPLLLPALLWQAPRPAPGQFELLAADVGQGNAVLVRTAGHTLVYDAGPRYSLESDAGHRVLVPLLRALGERVDTLLLSHRDTDHTGGARAVLAMQPQAALWGSLAAGHELQALRPLVRCEAGQRWRWDGVSFELLYPPATAYEGMPKPNALSCVLRVSNGRRSALLTGDIEAAQEARLVAAHGARADAAGEAPALPADVLLVPHHGSQTSSSAAFLDAVRPRWALVQAGYRNRFGHPAPAVLARLRERGIAVIDSPRCGAARWRSEAPEAVHCEREVSARYWQHRLP